MFAKLGFGIGKYEQNKKMIEGDKYGDKNNV